MARVWVALSLPLLLMCKLRVMCSLMHHNSKRGRWQRIRTRVRKWLELTKVLMMKLLLVELKV